MDSLLNVMRDCQDTLSSASASPFATGSISDYGTESLHLTEAAVQVLRDPSFKQRLVDRVCDLLMEDARLQQEQG